MSHTRAGAVHESDHVGCPTDHTACKRCIAIDSLSRFCGDHQYTLAISEAPRQRPASLVRMMSLTAAIVAGVDPNALVEVAEAVPRPQG
jgi:hypothetical protein